MNPAEPVHLRPGDREVRHAAVEIRRPEGQQRAPPLVVQRPHQILPERHIRHEPPPSDDLLHRAEHLADAVQIAFHRRQTCAVVGQAQAAGAQRPGALEHAARVVEAADPHVGDGQVAQHVR